ncbi:MAG: IS30 family transposase [Patescibacteria group bacterium]|nr:IS30 family transposase [Patescibacteria group bacterium]MDE2218602.1 IS30 family transposase [Patescibacteria group bacterium]
MKKHNKMVQQAHHKTGYHHLTQSDRDRIQSMKDSRVKQNEIAKIIGVNPGTVSREIKRNRRKKRTKKGKRDGPYSAPVAQQKAYVRRKYSKYQGKKINENKPLRQWIIRRLNRHWSPDEISGRMKLEKQPFYASKTAIYEWLYNVWGQRYCPKLYSKQYKPKKQGSKKTKRTLIPNRKGIELRPKEISEKAEYGHYEGDTVVSAKKTASKKALTVIYERKARYLKMSKIDSLKPALFNKAIIQMKKGLNVGSFTFDNGIETIKYEELNIETYFCDPYSSWQKGGIENANKMIRVFIPKGSDIGNYSVKYVRMVERILNDKPRKILGYKKPIEVMRENNLFIKSN